MGGRSSTSNKVRVQNYNLAELAKDMTSMSAKEKKYCNKKFKQHSW